MALPATDPSERLLRLIGRAEPALRDALLNAVNAARDEFTLKELEDLIEAGRYQDALDKAVQNGILSLTGEYAAVYTASGKAGAEFLTNALDVIIDFDQTNFRAVDTLRGERLRLIREFTAEQRRATREALVDGTARGLNPRDQARNFRDSIGLTRRQVAAVNRYRQLLETGSSEALQRQLRDKRFDRTVAAAIRTGEPLTAEQINRMTSRYRERYLKYRAEVIGRTEALRAVHSANDEAYRQAIESGLLDADQLQRKWVTAHDERVRGSHAVLDGIIKGPDEAWETSGGRLRYPGDPNAPASETIQCRCAIATSITAPEEDAAQAPANQVAEPSLQEQTAALYKGEPEFTEFTAAKMLDEAPNSTAMYFYSSNAYVNINKGLRTGKLNTMNAAQKKIAGRLDSMFKRSRTVQTEEFYRMTGSNTMKKVKVGSVMEDQAFVSTSKDYKIVEDLAKNNGVFGSLLRTGETPVIMKIRAPKGTPALDLEALSHFANEREVLLPRGSQFKVKSITDTDIGQVVEVEYIGANPANISLKRATEKRIKTKERALKYTWVSGDVIVTDPEDD